MTVSALPTPAPATTDPATFDTRADALVAALPTMISQFNTDIAALNLNDTTATSVTSLAISVASKSLTVDVSKSFQPGMSVKIARTASPSNWMHGDVTSYNTGTGALVVNVTSTLGSGTYTDWTITLSAPTLSSFSSAAEILAGTVPDKAIAPDQLRASMVGDVKAVAYETVPTGWLECNGASLNRTTYATLFAAIGTVWGTVDGNTFNIPDFRGRFLRGWDHAVARDPDRAARTASNTGGATGDNVGSVQAEAFKAHTHTFTYQADDGGATFDVARNATIVNVTTVKTTASTGGNETRPINVNVMYVIKY